MDDLYDLPALASMRGKTVAAIDIAPLTADVREPTPRSIVVHFTDGTTLTIGVWMFCDEDAVLQFTTQSPTREGYYTPLP